MALTTYRILTDSSADLSPEMVEELGVEVLPLQFTLQEKTYLDYPDGRDYPIPEFYAALRQGYLPKTAQVRFENYVESFEAAVNAGQSVLYIAFSSGLSGSYQAAVLAAKEVLSRHPGATISVVDSLCASLGQGLLVHYAVSLQRQGASLMQVQSWLEENKLKICHWFTVDDLEHLKRGGRISPAAALIGTALHIKPVLHVNQEGRLVAVEKVRGRGKSLEALVEHMAATCQNPREQLVLISHGDCLEDALKVKALLRERLGVQRVSINYVGPVIGSHSGPGTVALFFLGNQKDGSCPR